MRKQLLYFRRFYSLLKNLLKPTWQYLKQGYQAGLLKIYSKHFVVRHLQEFTAALKREAEELAPIHGVKMQRLHHQVRGLHGLLPRDLYYSYSILIAVTEEPKEECLATIEAACHQTSPQLEVLIGYQTLREEKIQTIIHHLKKKNPHYPIHLFPLEKKDEASILNQLAQEAQGNFLLPLREKDWIRPDFLFRCEQFFRLSHATQLTCLYTDECMINERGFPIPGHRWHKPSSLCFPYVFSDIGHSLLVPRMLWLEVKGLKRSLSHQGLWELAARISQREGRFHHLPFPLYASRSRHLAPIHDLSSFLQTMEEITTAKGLLWSWQPGLLPHTCRVIPKANKSGKVQVIIPFKNQKRLTLQTIESVLKQKGVQLHLTAVDNGSEDRSIAQAIEQQGGEVITIAEPFNYSRLNNLAVQLSQIAQEDDYLLFLNNDVILDEGALEEMCRWITQPMIGLVGSLLHYPNGLLQHGGVEIKRDGPAHQVSWSHSEKLRDAAKMRVTNELRLTDAVTAACALISRSLFLKVGGFDETWYPIAYSDTNLAVKVQAQGFKCLYTPYARGIHHESVTRDYDNIEDVETSRWLHNHFASHLDSFLSKS